MSSVVEVSADRRGDSSSGNDARAAQYSRWFEREYPRLVGIAKRVLDRDAASDAATDLAEDIAVEAFSRQRRRGRPDDATSSAVLRRCLDGCMDVMVGHPGSVPVHPELLGGEFDLDGRLALAELHGALSSMRTTDRHAGLLAVAAGYTPGETASLLQRPLDDVLDRLARVATRLADARRLGLAGPSGPTSR